MDLEQIKEAIKHGLVVCCGNSAYRVEKYTNGYYIVCSLNGYTIGLTWLDGTTLNGKESDFYIYMPRRTEHA